jgi:hypothetical protein
MSAVKSDLKEGGGLVKNHLNSRARLISRMEKNNSFSIASLVFGINKLL